MLRITILCENTVAPAPDILGEHGFAVLIETETDAFLFDTGQGHCLLHNAACLKKDLKIISAVFLSHGHFDHTGGLAQVLRMRGTVPVYGHPGIFAERFAEIKTGEAKTYRSIGIPASRAELEALGAGFVFNTAFTRIAPGLYLTGEAPRKTSFEKNDARLVVLREGTYVQDTIPDDQSLVLESTRGLVVILGCAHAGSINTLNHTMKNLPGQKIHAVIGGTHIGYLDAVQVAATIEQLKSFAIERIGVSHCTGLGPALQLQQAFGNKFFFANAGSAIEI